MEPTRESRKESSPLRVIEYVLATTMILGGLFLFTPFVIVQAVPSAPNALVEIVAGRPGLVFLGMAAIVAGIIHLIGLRYKGRTWRSFGLFLQILIRLYAMIAGWLIVGEIVYPWSATFLVFLVTIILWFNVRLTGNERNASN